MIIAVRPYLWSLHWGHIITDEGTVEHGACRFDPWLLTAVAIHNTDSAGAAVYAVHERVDERSANPPKK